MYYLAVNEDKADIYLYSIITPDYEGMNTYNLLSKLNAYTGKTITLHINSEGGDIIEAQGIFAFLKKHTAKVHTFIEGICASAASIIALAGDKISMHENALFMIHNPSGAAFGESEDLRSIADILDKMRDSISVLYENKTGLSHEAILDMMNKETWLNAHEALSLKFVDEVLPAIVTKNTSQDFQAGVKSERERLKALDDLYTPERKVMINEAKYITGKTAQDIALDLLRISERAKDSVFLNHVPKPDERKEAINAISEIINKMRGYYTNR